jgi:vacuolar-type H+-ATPase subunit D/Vma8
MSTVSFADVLESAREPGTSYLSAVNIANIMGLQQPDLATLAGVHHSTLRSYPESPKLQAALRDLMRVLSAIVEIQPDVEHALFVLKNHPIPSFRHKTLLQLVQEGRADAVVDYLGSISSGFVG